MGLRSSARSSAKRGKVWRHFTIVALFLDNNKTNDDGDGRRTAKKAKGFYLQNNKFARASLYFVHFFAVVAPLRHETSWFRTPALWSRWRQHKSCRFPLLNLDTVLSDSTRENFANTCQIKWNWISSMKFEAVRIHFLSDFFGLLSSKNFVTMATWRNDLCSLLSPGYSEK